MFLPKIEPKKNPAEDKAARLLQASYRGFASRRQGQWKLKYLQIRRQMVFKQNNRDSVNTMQYAETMSTLRKLVPHAVYSGLQATLLKLDAILDKSDDAQKTNASIDAMCSTCPWVKVLVPGASDLAIAEESVGVMLFLDLSGFVSLTEDIRKSSKNVKGTRQGHARRSSSERQVHPAESMVNIVNEHFVEAIAVVHEFNGVSECN
jgi:hypothetical protein